MLKILHTLPALDGGGADRIVFDYACRLTDVGRFDFIVHTEQPGILENELLARGCRVFHVPPLHKDKQEYKRQIRQIIRQGEYDIIHVSQGYRGLYFLYYAKKYGVPVRIAHSHMAYIPQSFKEKMVRIAATCCAKLCATHLFACGRDAARWMWGRRALDRDRVYVMKNAIPAERFGFSAAKRDAVRKELGLKDKFVVGHVARFSYQKNHEFLIRVFAEIKGQRDDAVLMLVGRGELEDEVKSQVAAAGLQDAVLFLGVRDDVPALLNAIAVVVLPSRFEGLPVTLIEVQANGLPAVVADTVTKEMALSDRLTFLPLAAPADQWAAQIINSEREQSANPLPGTGYDLTVAADDLRHKYLSMV